METNPFHVHARIDAEVLNAWTEAGWLMPAGGGQTRRFSDIDLARARLIRHLGEDLGINDEGIDVILDLVDQVHGLRRTLRELLFSIQAQPVAMRRRIVADLHEVASDWPGDEPDRDHPETT
jgi:chaperone modulatory protein CbpM